LILTAAAPIVERVFDAPAISPAGSPPPGGKLRAGDVEAIVELLQHLDREVTDPERIDLLRALESLKNAAAAAQVRVAVDFDESQRAEQEARGVPARLRGSGIGAQVALARRESPHRGGRHLGLARALVHEMPHTLQAMELGVLSEWRATLIGRETACLEKAHRQAVDTELCRDPDRVEALGDKKLVAEVRKLAYTLDPHSVVDRARMARDERRVTIRPAPDTMCYLTALLPVAEGVAAYASLTRAADSARAAGEERGKGAIMADTLVERLTGQSSSSVVPVSVGLIMTDGALLGDADEPAHLEGYGPVPPQIARELLTTATLDGRNRTWLRRLYASPTSGQLVAMDSRSHRFPKGLARLIRDRDQSCRTPWCNAPIRHIDHAEPKAGGGPTTASNGQGLCEACNHHKQAVGWRALPRPGPGHDVETTTPTGHRYRSRAPALARPGWVMTRPGLWTRVA
jgi:hypothetical protein